MEQLHIPDQEAKNVSIFVPLLHLFSWKSENYPFILWVYCLLKPFVLSFLPISENPWFSSHELNSSTRMNNPMRNLKYSSWVMVRSWIVSGGVTVMYNPNIHGRGRDLKKKCSMKYNVGMSSKINETCTNFFFLFLFFTLIISFGPLLSLKQF